MPCNDDDDDNDDNALVLAAGENATREQRVVVVGPLSSVRMPTIVAALALANRVHTADARPLHAILVHAHGARVHATAQTRLAEVAARNPMRVEFWDARELCAAAPAHADSAALTHVPAAERPAEVRELPRILVTDPLARWYDCQVGDVVALAEWRVHAGAERTMRVVV